MPITSINLTVADTYGTQSRDMSKIQEILTLEARSRIHLEDSVVLAQEQAKFARQQVAEHQTELKRMQASGASHIRELRVLRKSIREAEQTIENVLSQNRVYVQTLFQITSRLAEASGQDEQSALQQVIEHIGNGISSPQDSIRLESVWVANPELEAARINSRLHDLISGTDQPSMIACKFDNEWWTKRD